MASVLLDPLPIATPFKALDISESSASQSKLPLAEKLDHEINLVLAVQRPALALDVSGSTFQYEAIQVGQAGPRDKVLRHPAAAMAKEWLVTCQLPVPICSPSSIGNAPILAAPHKMPLATIPLRQRPKPASPAHFLPSPLPQPSRLTISSSPPVVRRPSPRTPSATSSCGCATRAGSPRATASSSATRSCWSTRPSRR